jgi:cytochrome P450
MSTMFDRLLEPRDKGLKIPPKSSLIDDAFVICLAGTDTTAFTLAAATFYILRQPEVERQLREELKGVRQEEREILAWSRVHKLPYLVSVLRL